VLRSWIERRRRGFAPPSAALGIAVGRGAVCAAHVLGGEQGWRVDWLRGADLPAPLFQGEAAPAQGAALTAALGKICADVQHAYLPVHVALPDPLGMLAVFELEEFPKTEKMRRNWVRWRFAQELPASEESFDYDCQDLGREDGKRLLLGQALNRSWLQCVKLALKAAGIVPWSINQAACYRFSHFYDDLRRAPEGGALVSLDPDAWSLMLWDARGRTRFLRARWRAVAAGGGSGVDYEGIAAEVERAVLSYVHGGRRRSVARLYVSGAEEAAAFVSLLNERVRETCVLLVPRAAAAAIGPAPALASASLVAAAA
jgi:hypothetical protein